MMAQIGAQSRPATVNPRVLAYKEGMTSLTGRLRAAGIFKNEAPKGPWGNSGDGGNSGGGSGGGSGPRNPWSFPPDGRRLRGAGGSLDELLRRARRGGPNFPVPTGSQLWLTVLGALLVVWVLFTSIHPIGPKERGVVTTLGRYSGTLAPGIQLTLPAPFQLVDVRDVTSVRTETFPQTGANLILTGDQNIVDLAYSVNWYIDSAPDYVFQIARPDDTVRATAESAMRAVVATTTLNEAIGEGRARMEAQVQLAMQQVLDEYRSGIRIQSVAIQKAAAPQEVDDAFKAVSAAQQEAQSNKNNAQGYAQQILAQAQGEAAEFDKIYEQYRLAPEVTRRRMYYETMEQVLARTDKTIVEAPGVTPYLPLPEVKRRVDPDVDAAAQPGAAK
jgi:modulator of FtsH protease HflK